MVNRCWVGIGGIVVVAVRKIRVFAFFWEEKAILAGEFDPKEQIMKNKTLRLSFKVMSFLFRLVFLFSGRSFD